VLDRVRAFTYARQSLGRAAPDAASALRDVVAVYSSHPSAPLALHARSAAMTAEDFRAVAAAALRVPAMRGSIHLMPADAGARAFRALPESSAARTARLWGFGINEERYAELRALLLATAAEPRTQKELVAALDLSAEQVKGATATMTREGSMVRVGSAGLRSNALRYAAHAIPQHDRAAALAGLAGEYLRTLGPARREDVAWWLGVPLGRADAALAEHATVDLGEGLLLRAGDERAFAEAPQPAGVDLLGKWDPLTMGHAPDGRARCGMEPRCYDFRGDGLPVVLVDGAAAGTWAMAAKGKRLEFSMELFEVPGARLRKAVERRADEVAALLA